MSSIEKTTKEKLLEEFWSKLRKNLMWRDSESGFVEKHITELINEVIDQTREEIIMAIPEEMKHDPETDSEESKNWIAGFNNCRNQILNKLKK